MSIDNPMGPEEITGENQNEKPIVEQEMTDRLELFRKSHYLTTKEMDPDRFIFAAKDSFRTAWEDTEKKDDPRAWELFLKSSVGRLLGEELLTPQENEELKKNLRLIPEERFPEKQPDGDYYDISSFDHIGGTIFSIREAIRKMGLLKKTGRRIFKK